MAEAIPEESQLALTSLTFKSARSEIAFRQSHLKKDLQMARWMLLILSVVQPLFLFFDRLVIKPEFWPQADVALRVSFSLITLITLALLSRVQRFSTFQVVAMSWATLLFAYVLTAQLLFRDDYALAALFDVLLLLCFYITGVTPIRLQVAITLPYTIAVMSMNTCYKTFDLHTLSVLGIVYLSTNLVGIAISVQRQYSLRIDYALRRALHQQTRTLQRLAFRDALTNCYNRRAFEQHFDDYQRAAKNAASDDQAVHIGICDLDHFKQVNDTYGHDIGDRVIMAFARTLTTHLRPVDGVYRFGGEEFVIVVSGCAQDVVLQRIDAIMAKLNQTGFAIAELKKPVTASFGVTRLGAAETWQTALERADTGLYQAKKNGRNQQVFVACPAESPSALR